MKDGAAQVHHDSVGDSRNDEFLDNVPRMEDSIVFQKVVVTSIPRDLQFPTHSDGAVQPFALLDALVDLAVVVFEVEGVVVEAAESHFNVKLSKLHKIYISDYWFFAKKVFIFFDFGQFLSLLPKSIEQILFEMQSGTLCN